MTELTRKRRPLLADLVLADHGWVDIVNPKWHAQAKQTLLEAKKFVLDAQAAVWLANMVKDHPRIIADAQDFAIPAFKKMWIEVPFGAFYEAITGRPTDMSGDAVVGYLFDGPVVKVASCGFDVVGSNDLTCGWVMAEYVLHRPMSESEQIIVSQALHTSRLGLNVWMWGETASHWLGLPPGKNTFDLGIADRMTEDQRAGMRALRDNHTVRLVPLKNPALATHAYEATINGSAGDLRNIIALLLFLNRTPDIRVTKEFGHSRGFIGNKLRPFISHSTITLRMDPSPRWIKLVAGEGVHRRLHDVRGHYAHDRQAKKGCLHGATERQFKDFGEHWIEYEPLRWKCDLCGGKRWWQPEHQRGQISEGGVVQSYKVTR